MKWMAWDYEGLMSAPSDYVMRVIPEMIEEENKEHEKARG